MKRFIAGAAISAVLISAAAGGAAPYLLNGKQIKPGTVSEKALSARLRWKINVTPSLDIVNVSSGPTVIGYGRTLVREHCGPYGQAISGGWSSIPYNVFVSASWQNMATSEWDILFDNLSGSPTTINAFAVCARIGTQ